MIGHKIELETLILSYNIFWIQVAVVDEIQMIGDPYRGASFTRAILGLPAKEMHVCGDPAALPLIEFLAQEAGRHYYLHHASLCLNHLSMHDGDNYNIPHLYNEQVSAFIIGYGHK